MSTDGVPLFLIYIHTYIYIFAFVYTYTHIYVYSIWAGMWIGVNNTAAGIGNDVRERREFGVGRVDRRRVDG